MVKKQKARLGRKPKVIPNESEILNSIEEMALHQCRDTTIAECLGIDVKTFKRHYAKKCVQKRAEGKIIKLEQQFNNQNPTMLIWWGKQHLGQTDKQQVEVGTMPPIIIKHQPEPGK